MAFLKRERVNLGRRRLRNILETYTIATGRTLENKIADAGPFNQRIDPHILTIALREMIAAGEIQIHSEGEGKVRWYYLSGVPEDKKIARFGELDAVYQRTQQKDFTLRLGQALEIAVSRALQGQVVFDSMGHYKDLEEHDDSTLYSKEEPPSLISGRAISGKRKLDFVLIGAGAVRAGIEVKNIREWIYVDREEVLETLKKCVELDAVPILIARRIAYQTFSVLHECGVIVHQTFRQRYANADAQLAELVRRKDMLGYHDVLVGNEPDERLVRFIHTNLPSIVGAARNRFDGKKELLLDFADGRMSYGEFVTRVRGRTIWESKEGQAEEPDDSWSSLL